MPVFASCAAVAKLADRIATLEEDFAATDGIATSVPQSADYTTTSGDSGNSIDHLASDPNARTVTINGPIYPVGTYITGSNMTVQVQSVAMTTDTMHLAGAGTTGTRSVAQYGEWTARKVADGVWLIWGTAIT